MKALTVVRTVAELRRAVGEFRAASRTIGMVPTMGALHAWPRQPRAGCARSRRRAGGVDLRQYDPVRAQRGFRNLFTR